MKIKIHVTKEILERSAMCITGANRPFNCAIALAVRDMLPEYGAYYSGLYTLEESRTAEHPEVTWVNGLAVRRFMEDFDDATPEQRGAMSPVDFEIDVPSEVIDKIGIGEVYRILSESKTLELVAI